MYTLLVRVILTVFRVHVILYFETLICYGVTNVRWEKEDDINMACRYLNGESSMILRPEEIDRKSSVYLPSYVCINVVG